MVVARRLVEPAAFAPLTRPIHRAPPTSPGHRPGFTCIRDPYERMEPMAPSLQIHPDRDAFDRLATAWPLVPVWAEVLADVGTPVGLFPAIAGDGPGVLFESVER